MSALPCRTTTSQEAGYPSLADTWEGVRMFGHQTSSSDRGTSVVQDSLHGFANMLALAAAFLCAGQIWNFTSDPMYHFLMNTYGDASVAELGTYVSVLDEEHGSAEVLLLDLHLGLVELRARFARRRGSPRRSAP